MKVARYNAASGAPLECSCPADWCAVLAAQGVAWGLKVTSVAKDCGHARVNMTCLLISNCSHLDILGGLGDPLLNGTLLFSS